MHWLASAAARAGVTAAEVLEFPETVSLSDAWEIASRTLGVSQAELASLIGPALGYGVAEFEVDAAAAPSLPERLARKYHVFPLSEESRRIVVATADPTNFAAEQAIEFSTGKRAVFVVAPPSVIEDALFAAYGGGSLEHVLGGADDELADVVRIVEELAPEAIAAQEIEAAPVVKLGNLILRDAVRQGASDIHIEPGSKSGIVRFRVDGVLHRRMQLSMVALNRVVSRFKVLGRMDIADRMRPQDGRTRVVVEGRNVDLRISTVCARDAEKCVIRILRPETTRKLDEIGIGAGDLGRLRQLLNCRNGIVIVTGPTGSGKTTTMYSAIRELATGEVNISTVEDPVEYELPGITQIQVETKRGVTFANSLRALLRQDPDVIFIGEIRDEETAEIAARAAMTGHLVLATLHTNDALSAVTRLADLGLDRQTIAATLRGMLAQRLVRRACPSCAQGVDGPLTNEESALRRRYGVVPRVRARGCQRCSHTGYRGRLPIMEVALVTDAVSQAIAAGESLGILQRVSAAEGMTTLRDDACARVLNGETTLQEIDRVLGDGIQSAASTVREQSAVLIVNADPAWRRLARAVLEHDGLRVMEAVDNAEAGRLMSSGERFSLVLTDMAVTPASAAISDEGAAEPLAIAPGAFTWAVPLAS